MGGSATRFLSQTHLSEGQSLPLAYRANLLPRELSLSQVIVESNLREDTVQIVDMHSGSETLTATLADRRVARFSRRLIELHAELSGALKNMEKLSERDIEQRGDHSDRVQNREKTVELSTQPVLRNCERESCHRNREQENERQKIQRERLHCLC